MFFFFCFLEPQTNLFPKLRYIHLNNLETNLDSMFYECINQMISNGVQQKTVTITPYSLFFQSNIIKSIKNLTLNLTNGAKTHLNSLYETLKNTSHKFDTLQIIVIRPVYSTKLLQKLSLFVENNFNFIVQNRGTEQIGKNYKRN